MPDNRRYLLSSWWTGMLKYASLRSILHIQSPDWSRSCTTCIPSILKCWYFMYWFSGRRLITGLEPPSFLGTRNILEKNPCVEGLATGRIAVDLFWDLQFHILLGGSNWNSVPGRGTYELQPIPTNTQGSDVIFSQFLKWSAVLPASMPIGAGVMNPKSCEMALVGMVKSVGGVTASDQGGEGIIWEGSLEGCLSSW